MVDRLMQNICISRWLMTSHIANLSYVNRDIARYEFCNWKSKYKLWLLTSNYNKDGLTFNLHKFPTNSQIPQAGFSTTNFIQNLLPAPNFLQIPFQLPNFTSLLPDYQRYTKFASSLQLYYHEWGAGTAPRLHNLQPWISFWDNH